MQSFPGWLYFIVVNYKTVLVPIWCAYWAHRRKNEYIFKICEKIRKYYSIINFGRSTKYKVSSNPIVIAEIGHFRVPPGLCIKTRLSAQPLIWKWFFSLMQVKLIFTRKVVKTWPHFESEGFWNTEVAYWLLRFSSLVFQIQKLGILTGSSQIFCKY